MKKKKRSGGKKKEAVSFAAVTPLFFFFLFSKLSEAFLLMWNIFTQSGVTLAPLVFFFPIGKYKATVSE